MQKKILSLSAGLALFAMAPAYAGFINFEDAPDRGLADNDPVTTQYQASDGITFQSAFLEAINANDDNPQGFKNDQTGNYDDDFSAPGEPGLGNWFLRSKGEISGDDGRGGTGIYLSIIYDEPVSAATGQIWDIDGNSGQGTEQWRVVALNGGTEQASQTSPEGTSIGPDSLDGLPWRFSLSGTRFDRLDFEFIGTKETGVGLAFDNFNSDSTAVPTPSVLALLGLGLLALAYTGRARFNQG